MSESLQLKIADLIMQDTMSSITAELDKKVEELKASIEARIDGAKVIAENGIKEIEAQLEGKPLVINVGTVKKPKGELVHKSFKTIINILKATKRKEKNIMLVGGAGGGKTHLASTIAKTLKVDFYPMSVGLQTTKSDLLGFINATGTYMPSPIRLAYENGGLLLLDEFDAAHAGVITILNSLLANGHCSFPDKIVQKHPNFVCLCACNTYGKGGTIDYVGRNRLDAATLDRFIIVDVDYDSTLEKKLTNNEKWFEVIKTARETINKYGIKMIISPRASMDGADLLEAGFKPKEVVEMTIFKGCDKDAKVKIMNDIDRLLRELDSKESKGESTTISGQLDISKYENYINIEYVEEGCINIQTEGSYISRNGGNYWFNLYGDNIKKFLILYLGKMNEYNEYIFEESGFDKLYVNFKDAGMNAVQSCRKDVRYNTKESILRIIDIMANFDIEKTRQEEPGYIRSMLLQIVIDGNLHQLDLGTGEYRKVEV